jgi:ParB-like chromosome segregation protein Spo0J
MPKLAIKNIDIDPTVQVRRGNHEPTIRRYEESFDKLPPVDVFNTPDGLLLADGFHRVAAAERLGKREIEARVHKGAREDALEFAVTNNTKNGDPLSSDERDDGIRRLRQLHPDWPIQKIADAMSVSKATVSNVAQADEVARSVFTGKQLSTSHYREIARAPKDKWEPLAKAASERGWSRDATALAARNIKDDRIPEERKRAILKGRADPVIITPEGQFAVPADVVGRQIKDMAANDAVLALERALEVLSKLRLFRSEVIVSTIGRPRLDRLMEEMPGYIAFMEEVMNAAKKQSRKMEVIS